MTEGAAHTVDASFAARLTHGIERVAPVAPLVAAGAALVGYGVVMGRRSLSLDEAAGVEAAAGPFDKVLERALEHDPGQVAHRVLLHAATTIDRSEWWVRAPSLLAALAALVFVAALAWMLGGRLAGVAAGAIFGLAAGVAEASQLARPFALALAAVALSSCLFVRAMTTGGVVAWACYGLVSAMLPLVHPGAAAVLLAHAAALAVARDSVPWRRALPIVAFVTLVAGLLAVATLIDRLDAVGSGAATLRSIGSGLARAAGWSPLVAGLACAGVASLARRSPRALSAQAGGAGEPPWRAALVAGLALAPLVVILVAGVGFAVFPRYALVLCAPGLAVAAGVGLASVENRNIVALLASGIGVIAALQLIATATLPVREDWRSAARLVRTERKPNETVVVLPRRGRPALAYYAPLLRVRDEAHGEGAWLLLATRTEDASRLARTAVTTPRYALLEEETFGKGLSVQHWVRP